MITRSYIAVFGGRGKPVYRMFDERERSFNDADVMAEKRAIVIAAKGDWDLIEVYPLEEGLFSKAYRIALYPKPHSKRTLGA